MSGFQLTGFEGYCVLFFGMVKWHAMIILKFFIWLLKVQSSSNKRSKRRYQNSKAEVALINERVGIKTCLYSSSFRKTISSYQTNELVSVENVRFRSFSFMRIISKLRQLTFGVSGWRIRCRCSFE